MFNITRKETMWGGRPLVFETGKVARQADGAVMVSYGQTTVLCTVVAQRSPREGVDFFPLTVNYEEKAFANGKIPGGFFKREGRPGEKETLVCRLIDRPIRPLFAAGFRNETQVICTVLSHDMVNDPDMVAMVGASAALTISGIPFMGPIAGCRVGYIDGEYILNTTVEQRPDTVLDLVVAGTQEGVLMVESEASELSEEIMLGAVTFGHKEMRPVFDAIIELAEACAKEPWDIPTVEKDQDLVAKVGDLAGDGMREAYGIQAKSQRQDRISEVKKSVAENLADDNGETPKDMGSILKDMERDIVRSQILKTGDRIDGRGTSDVRQIIAEVGSLPRSHGSALFTRGETQALVVATLGTGQDEQIMDVLEGEYRERFMLHYNFPPYSVGEARFLRGPGRREIGHGKLAWRAIHPLLPTAEDFPYTIRVVSEVTESNGSSSMATVCGTSLSLMDAGVPLTRPVAGIAMGLIKEGDDFAVLSDILGDEDHLGDMDFKVAGSENGITSLQMDIKITSITEEILKVALEQAHEGRLHILGEMGKAIGSSRDSVSDTAPRITTITVPKDRIREIIGPGGKVVREICETTGTKIDIEDDGTIKVAAVEAEAGEAALAMIRDIIAEPEIGEIYTGKVVKIMDFGAFVNFIGKRDGLVHISEVASTRIGAVSDVLNEGDEVKVKVLGIDDRGKIKLSMKVVDQETGEEIKKEAEAE
ncbi:MAG: polyribonucleotide nucleotidyltransferase [Rhodospirillaceae bacterium]|nr:polyribonucleotide nucleotidyltransferase [Rhodospirillaceae bacterium]MBT5676948.1 polyribonucleotide nucleotidyltransferase [Rhodospirillaceae bacterium]